jgi:3',5'-cyclic AMP phosphodiesterase CpdA
MRRVVQISDLHFGNNDPSLLQPLREAIWRIQPNLLIICGDLAEHASSQEFQQARDFLESLPKPQIVVPGNHDLPFYNLVSRGTIGLSRYRRFVTTDTHPRWEDDEMVVIGANTSRLWPIRGGSLSSLQLERLASEFAAVPEGKMRLLVTHHPFDLPGTQDRHLIVSHAKRSIQRLAPLVDILLAGHIHISSMGSTATRYKTAGHALVFVQAGTAVSRRDKGEVNSFNALQLYGHDAQKKTAVVETWTWRKEQGYFACKCTADFRLESEGWANVAPEKVNAEVQEEPAATVATR